MTLTRQEMELIQFIRGLDFDDLLDAVSGIHQEMEQAGIKSLQRKEAGDTLNADGFSERADVLEKLGNLLGYANDDYRNHIDIDSEPDKLPEQKEVVTQMTDSTVSEIIHLFEVMKKYGVKCSLEFQSKGYLDPLFGIVDYPILSCEYFEREGGPDSILLILGDEANNVEFNFELNISCFKDISDIQIFTLIANDHYAAFFNSGSIPAEGIEEARNYKELDSDLEDAEIVLDPQEEDYFDKLDFLHSRLQMRQSIKSFIKLDGGTALLTVGFYESK
jgi:hypothetical protein